MGVLGLRRPVNYPVLGGKIEAELRTRCRTSGSLKLRRFSGICFSLFQHASGQVAYSGLSVADTEAQKVKVTWSDPSIVTPSASWSASCVLSHSSSRGVGKRKAVQCFLY